ncbi:phosphoribosyl-AMP cyclohydrolase [Tumebacillus flagellatus]|uniref:Uncharacterized protein n=1 Tax=Tumebacillus flagellatus TaxID=1157490 RepID=A0A074LRD5_9BACL|nr:phosphoribosyl-AMP cyclohydrolase [Tumebacillus flagellatus]KEO83634.1 hypothetical protein EL26_09495 [Tumebacillus flagellatus]
MTRHSFLFTGTPLVLTEGEAYHLRKYWKKGRQAGTIQPLAGFDVDADVDALQALVQLACAHCHRAHHASCCEGGFPFPPEEELLLQVDEHLDGIAELLPREVVRDLLKRGLYEQHLETAGHRTIGTYEENCKFCRVEGHGPACMAHRYALQSDMHPSAVKPLSCLLYPLDLIRSEEDGRTLLTALTERTARFSRWGADYRLDYLCANYELRGDPAAAASENIRKDLPPDVFARELYRPAYVEGRDLLATLYGEPFYHELQTLIQGGSRL